MKRLAAGVARCGLLLLLAPACSSSSGSASSSSGFAQQYCALLEPCCAAAGLSTTGQNCTSLIEFEPGYNAANGQACLDATKAATGQADFCSTFGGSLPACKNVFSSSSSGGGGTAQPGQTCMLDTDCAPSTATGGGAACIATSSADGGFVSVCVQTLPGTAGQGPCVGTQSGDVTSYSWNGVAPPSPGYICNVADGDTCSYTTHKCTALATAGQPCTSDSACVSADYCDFSGTAGSVCAARVADGASCAGSLASACLSTSTCDSTTQTCKALLPAGSACTTGEPCQSHSCVNGKCGGSGNLGLDILCGQ